MKIIVTKAKPESDPPIDFSRRLRPENAGLTVVPNPSDKTAGDTALTLLLSMGKNLADGGARTMRHAELRCQVDPWMSGLGITTLAITSAHMYDSRNMKWILDMLPPNVTVILVADHGAAGRLRASLSPAVLRAVNVSRPIHRDYEEILAQFPPIPVADEAEESPKCAVADDLPQVDSLRFLAESRRALSRAAADHVHREYASAFRDMSQLAVADEASARQALADLMKDATSTADIVTRMHALVSAQFSRGTLIQIDREDMLRSLRATPTTAVSPSHWARLNAFVLTEHAAQVALYLAGLTANQSQKQSIDDVTRLLSTCPEGAKPYLKAHLRRRCNDGAAKGDLYLTTSMTLETLRRARDVLDLPITGTMIDATKTRTEALTTRIPIKVEVLG